MWKKIISTVITSVMVITVCISSVNSIKAAPEDGDICTNPWEEFFTDADPGDLEIPTGETTKDMATTKNKETTLNKNIKLKKGKVVSATRKNKKAKITVKKIKGAKGYLIQISTNKKFNKILVKKIIRARNVTITSKKIKNKKRLYVRTRAYKLNGKTKVWGKWSAKKVIKIKKK